MSICALGCVVRNRGQPIILRAGHLSWCVRLLTVVLFRLVSNHVKSPMNNRKCIKLRYRYNRLTNVRHNLLVSPIPCKLLGDPAVGAPAVSALSPCTASAMVLSHTVEDRLLRYHRVALISFRIQGHTILRNLGYSLPPCLCGRQTPLSFATYTCW